jgi:hypothetical protein
MAADEPPSPCSLLELLLVSFLLEEDFALTEEELTFLLEEEFTFLLEEDFALLEELASSSLDELTTSISSSSADVALSEHACM